MAVTPRSLTRLERQILQGAEIGNAWNRGEWTSTHPDDAAIWAAGMSEFCAVLAEWLRHSPRDGHEEMLEGIRNVQRCLPLIRQLLIFEQRRLAQSA